MDSAPGRHGGRPAGYDGPLAAAGGYLVLLLFGLLQGLIGCFQYSRVFPVAAVAFAVAIGATCVLGAWGMHRALGGLMPAIGWIAASYVLAMGTPGGSVVITNTSAGKWFLFGGSVCALAGVLAAFIRWSPARRYRR